MSKSNFKLVRSSRKMQQKEQRPAVRQPPQFSASRADSKHPEPGHHATSPARPKIHRKGSLETDGESARLLRRARDFEQERRRVYEGQTRKRKLKLLGSASSYFAASKSASVQETFTVTPKASARILPLTESRKPSDSPPTSAKVSALSPGKQADRKATNTTSLTRNDSKKPGIFQPIRLRSMTISEVNSLRQKESPSLLVVKKANDKVRSNFTLVSDSANKRSQTAIYTPSGNSLKKASAAPIGGLLSMTVEEVKGTAMKHLSRPSVSATKPEKAKLTRKEGNFEEQRREVYEREGKKRKLLLFEPTKAAVQRSRKMGSPGVVKTGPARLYPTAASSKEKIRNSRKRITREIQGASAKCSYLNSGSNSVASSTRHGRLDVKATGQGTNNGSNTAVSRSLASDSRPSQRQHLKRKTSTAEQGATSIKRQKTSKTRSRDYSASPLSF